jgi:L-seryl-tRNA(Ser) seleniumtransferase
MASETGLRRKVPSVDALLRSDPGRRASAWLGRPLLKLTVTHVLGEVRKAAERGAELPNNDVILARAAGLASRIASGLTPAINATGVILHTGLGRAPLPETAIRAAARAGGYGDLEIDRGTGQRGRRGSRAEAMLVALTGAEAALIVNNCAAAILLALSALARGKHVLVSRGELIEIGGEFRIPDILRASRAKLIEVGTTNRTRVTDYRSALNDRVALVLKVHPSNYRVLGFTAAPSTKDLASLAAKAGIPLLYDLGSGLLERLPGAPADEPTAMDALRDGADLVTFSGDKLLGGPQAGVVLGRADLVERLRRDPIARAVRVDKMQVAALESVLATYVRGEQATLPVWRMLREPADSVRRRADELALSLDGDLEGAHVVRTESVVGGGSVPGTSLASWGVRVRSKDPVTMAARLRNGSPSVFCRVEQDSTLFDVRTLERAQLPDLRRAILYALEGDDLPDDDVG